MATEKTPNYTEAQEQEMREIGRIDQSVAEMLAAKWNKTPRQVIAKAVRMRGDGVEYIKKTRTTKTGAPVESKVDIVAEIAAIVNGNLTGLEEAPKEALRAVRDYVKAA